MTRNYTGAARRAVTGRTIRLAPLGAPQAAPLDTRWRSLLPAPLAARLRMPLYLFGISLAAAGIAPMMHIEITPAGAVAGMVLLALVGRAVAGDVAGDVEPNDDPGEVDEESEIQLER